MFFGVFTSPLHEGADRSWSSIELGNFVAFNDIPEAVFGGKVWGSFVHEGRNSIRKNTVDNIAVSCNPPDISGTPVDLPSVRNEIEHVLGREIRVYHVSTDCVLNPFGFAR